MAGGMAAARAEAETALREKRTRQQQMTGGGAGSTSMSAGDLSAIEQFQAQKQAARKRTNALGQTEAGVPMWKVRPRLLTWLLQFCSVVSREGPRICHSVVAMNLSLRGARTLRRSKQKRSAKCTCRAQRPRRRCAW